MSTVSTSNNLAGVGVGVHVKNAGVTHPYSELTVCVNFANLSIVEN